jgi:hypothetical protein
VGRFALRQWQLPVRRPFTLRAVPFASMSLSVTQDWVAP